MNLKLAACLLAVALLLVWAFFFTGGRDRTTRSASPAPTSRTATDLLAPEPDLAPAPASPTTATPTPTDPSERSAVATAAPTNIRNELAGLTGRVVESDGTPIPDMHVALLAFDASLLFDGAGVDEVEASLELEETTTDSAGRFLLAGADQQAFNGLGIDLAGPRATLRVIDHTLVHRERTDIGDVVLAPFGVLTGRVVDEHGAPVSGARVRCGPFPAEILQGQPQEFRADSLIALNRVTMGGEGQAILELPGWIRSMIDRLPVPTTQTTADGTFRLVGVALSSIVGGVDLRGYVGVTFGPLDMASGAHDLGTVELKRGRTVRGVVEDSSGDPVVGAEVHAGAELVPSIVAVLQTAAPTDEDGRFELTGVAENGQIVATARRSPHEAWSTTVSARHEGVLIELESLVRLTVNVRDEAGQPLSGADLRLVPSRQSDPRMGFADVLAFLPKPPSPRGAFAELEPGRYVNANLGAGRYEVTVRVAGLAPGILEAECRASENEITVVCPVGRRVELSVVAARTREPIVGARASVLRASGAGFTKLAIEDTDAAGRAVLGPLPQFTESANPGPIPNETMLLVEHPRHGSHSAVLDPDAATLVVELFAGGELAGRVHWAGAVPTCLYMLTLEYRGAEDFLELFHLPRFTVTSLAGEFHCGNLAPGKYGVALTDRFLQQDPLGMIGEQYEPPTLYRGEIEIENGETTELVIDLTPTGRGTTASVAGRVRFQGRGLDGAEVTVRGNEIVKVTTDSSGRFETPPFAILDSTSIEIEGDVPLGGGATRHMQLHEESVELAQGDVHQIDVDLYPLTVRARVVAEASGDPVTGAQVSVRLQRSEGERGDVIETVPTSAAGEVELIVLAPGEYVLSASAEGFTRASCKVQVGADGSSEPALLSLQHAVPCAGRVQAATAPGPAGFSYMWVQAVEGSNSSGTRLQAPDNVFELDGLPPGKYTAHIFLGGQRGAEVAFELGKDGDENLVLAFTPEAETEEEEED